MQTVKNELLSMSGHVYPQHGSKTRAAAEITALFDIAWETVMKSRMLVFAVLASLLLIVAGQRAIWAQSGAGSIQGTVQDATHAVIPGASIRVANTATGVVSTTKSNGVGFYQVPGLFTGTYSVTVTAPGMEAYKTSIDLLVAQNGVINPVLTAGSVTQQIVVSGNAVQLTTTDNGTITSTLENARINQLPMNVRNLTGLVGVTTSGMANSGLNINGMPQEALEYSVDGTTTQNNMFGGMNYSQQQLIDPDSVSEVRVKANGTGAEYATPGTVIVSTKSGTNRLHGTAFETARNNAIGIAKSRQDPSNYSAPHYVRNEFGASAGGPVILPHIYHGKDKTFWFFAYERYSLADSTAVLANVPTVAMSQGDFSGLVNAKGVLQTLYDPSTTKNSSSCAATGKANAYCRTPFPNNRIPVSEESPLAKLYYELAPLPTNSADPLVTKNLTSLNSEFQLEPQETFRLDHEFNENNRAYLRYTQNLNGVDISGGPRNRAAAGIPVGAAVGGGGYQNLPSATYLAAIGYTHIFSPTFYSETVVSQQWYSEKVLPGAAALTPTVNYESMLGLPNNFGELGFPKIGNGNLIFPLGTSQFGDTQLSQIVSTIDENLTKTVGRHQMQFGGRFRHQRMANYPETTNDYEGLAVTPTAVYQPTSGANYAALANTGNDDASFFIGSANNYTVNLPLHYAHYHVMEFDAYFQDNYHVGRNLTVNLGLRYEAHPALWTKYGVMNAFDLKNDAQVLAAPPSTLIAEGVTTQPIITNMENIGVKFETPAEAGMPANTLLSNYDLNFLPRVGIAFQPFGGRHGTVIRGAYGRYVYPLPENDYVNHPEENAPLTNTYIQSYATAAQAIDGLPNELLRYNDPVVFGVEGENTANVVNTNVTNSILPGISITTSSPNAHPALVTETNFTIEQAIKGNSALRVSWVWTHSTNMYSSTPYNHQPTNYEWEMATGKVPPTGGASVIGTPQQNTYSATAMGPYDQTTWGNNLLLERNGWSNYNALQMDYQRLFHHGAAYQISYDFAKPLRMGGNTGGLQQGGSGIDNDFPYADFPGALGAVGTMIPAYGAVYPGVAPPALPAGLPKWAEYHAMDKYQSYQLDSAEPIQHIRFTGIVDLPVGRGKRFLGNVNHFWNEVVGGFQIAGDGNIVSQLFQPGAGHWGPVNPIHVYKHKRPVADCRSGVCEKGFLWYNGYLAPTVTTGVSGSVCTTNCVTGLPADYVPEQTPIDNDPTSAYYGDDDVQVSAPGLNGGNPLTVAYDAGPKGSNYLQKSWYSGPINYTEDISIFKVFPIKEGMNLRVNVDAFNALNVQGYNNPGTDGIEHMLNSANTPRQIQLTTRFTF
jgi:Carboxypeptidase regulatory-like domain